MFSKFPGKEFDRRSLLFWKKKVFKNALKMLQQVFSHWIYKLTWTYIRCPYRNTHGIYRRLMMFNLSRMYIGIYIFATITSVDAPWEDDHLIDVRSRSANIWLPRDFQDVILSILRTFNYVICSLSRIRPIRHQHLDRGAYS